MTASRRQAVEEQLSRVKGPCPVSNASLELDRYLSGPVTARNGCLEDLQKRVADSHSPPLYSIAYCRWKRVLSSLPLRIRLQKFQVVGRVIVGLGNESARETSITLHPLYGVPLLPGSALKGLARHYAEIAVGGRLATGGDHHRVLFGDQASAGYVTFFDAWYCPGSAPEDRPLALDVMTVHHPRYYRWPGKEDPGPSDFDDPNPVRFLSARGCFLAALAGPSGEWAELAMDLLARALEGWGIGAKTSAGYGRMKRCSTSTEAGEAKEPVNPGAKIKALEDQLSALSDKDLPGQITYVYQQVKDQKMDRLSYIRLLRKIHARLARAGLLQKAKWQEKDWVRQLIKDVHDAEQYG